MIIVARKYLSRKRQNKNCIVKDVVVLEKLVLCAEDGEFLKDIEQNSVKN